MDDYLEIQRVGRRQSAPSSGGGNTFLDLIANPFVAAVCAHCRLWPDQCISDLSSFKKMPFGHLSVLHLVLLPCLRLSSPYSVLDILSSMLRRSNMQMQNMLLLRLIKGYFHG